MSIKEEKTLIKTGDEMGNEVIHYPVTKAEYVEDLKDKKTSTFVIGHANSGYTLADCDYLCTGTSDQIQINQAIKDLPENGGKITILEGHYILSGNISVNKDNVSLQGMGNSTIIDRNNTSSGTYCFYISGSYVNISNFYTCNSNFGIFISSNSNNNTITGNTCNDNGSYGIQISSNCNNNTVTCNNCTENDGTGIIVFDSYNTITGNNCIENGGYGIYISSNCNNNTITGNTCNDNSSYDINLNSTSSKNIVTSNQTNTFFYNGGTSNIVANNYTD